MSPGALRLACSFGKRSAPPSQIIVPCYCTPLPVHTVVSGISASRRIPSKLPVLGLITTCHLEAICVDQNAPPAINSQSMAIFSVWHHTISRLQTDRRPLWPLAPLASSSTVFDLFYFGWVIFHLCFISFVLSSNATVRILPFPLFETSCNMTLFEHEGSILPLNVNMMDRRNGWI